MQPAGNGGTLDCLGVESLAATALQFIDYRRAMQVPRHSRVPTFEQLEFRAEPKLDTIESTNLNVLAKKQIRSQSR